MVCRVAFVGHPDWLTSDCLREVCRHRRVECVGSDTLDSFGFERSGRHADVLLLHFAHDFDCCIAAAHRALRSGCEVRCVAVTRDAVDAEIARIVAAGSWGQFPESSPPSTYCDAIAQVAAGRLAYPADILNRIATSGGRMTLMPKATERNEPLPPKSGPLSRSSLTD